MKWVNPLIGSLKYLLISVSYSLIISVLLFFIRIIRIKVVTIQEVSELSGLSDMKLCFQPILYYHSY